MPKVWLCPIAVGEEDDANHCLHCIYLTPPEDCDKDHKTLFVWCDSRLKRVFVRDSSDNEENGINNSKSGRPYRPIGWALLQVRQGHYVKGIPRLKRRAAP